MQFKPGKSGNPNGKPAGAKDKRTAARAYLEPHKQALLDKAVELALAGDVQALKLCVDRVLAPMRAVDSPVSIPLAKKGTLSEQAQAIIQAAAQGHITPREAQALLSALGGVARIQEIDELTRRIEALENEHQKPD